MQPDLPTGITHLQIDPTSRCDLTCIYCVGRHWKQGGTKVGTVEKLCRECAQLQYVHLQGEGEPFVHRDFLTMVERVRATGADVGFITNGRHLSTNNVRRLIELRVRSVGISVDSLDPEVYRRLRHAELEPVLAGLHRLLDARHNEQVPDVYLTAVLTRTTFDGFARIVEFSERLGLSPPSVQPLQGMPTYRQHYPSELDGELLTAEQHRTLRGYWEKRDATRRSLGLRTYFEDLFSMPNNSDCPFLERSLHVRFDGQVFPCCFMKNDRDTFGHLEREDLPSIWMGEQRKSMREAFAAGQVPSPCDGCPVLNRSLVVPHGDQ